MNGNFPRDASPFLFSFQEGAPLPTPFPEIWRSRANPTLAHRSHSHSPVSVYHPPFGPSVSMVWGALPAPIPLLWASLSTSPERQEAKQPQTPGEVGVGSLCLGDAPHPASEDPGRAARALTCLLAARSAAGATQFPPWGLGLVLAEALLWGSPSFFLAPARFPRASRSVFLLELALRLRAPPPQLFAPRTRPGCAPPRTRLRLGGPPPASYPRRKTGNRLPHLERPGRRARGSLSAMPGTPSSPGRIPQGFLLQPVPRLSMGLQ